MKTYYPEKLEPQERHQLLIGAIGPRPIAFASSISGSGIPNLAPYSFFNLFSSTPPVMVFSPNTRVQTIGMKDTLKNIREVPEVVINVVSYEIAHQMSLCGQDFPEEVSEFEKSGLTPMASLKIKPFRVKESPAQFECKVREIITLDNNAGAANLVIADVVAMHFDESIFDSRGYIDPQKIDLVGRLGRSFYCRTDEESLFRMQHKPAALGIGFDQLPEEVKKSSVLKGSQLAKLASVSEIPQINTEILSDLAQDFIHLLDESDNDATHITNSLHHIAASLLDRDEIEKAWQIILTRPGEL